MKDPRPRLGRSLAATLWLQIVSAMALFTVAVLAGRIADEIGAAEALVGYYQALIFLGAGVMSYFAARPIAQWGPVRAIQLGLLLAVPALWITVDATFAIFPLSALVLGVGYGPFTPAASLILARASSQRWRGLIFSLKQSGAPLGGFLAGLVLPALEKPYGWRFAVGASALCLLASIAVMQPLRAPFDAERSAGAPAAHRRSREALRFLLEDRGLRRLSLASFVYAMMQMSLFSLLVVYLLSDYLVGDNPDDLIIAGGIYAMMNVGGIASRIVWGWLADRFERPRAIFALLGIAGGVTTLGIAAIEPTTSLASVRLLCFVAGVTISGWNGLYLAELSRSAPVERVGDTVGSAMLFTYFGLVIGASLCTTLVLVAESYRVAFNAMGVLCTAAGIWVALGVRAGRSRGTCQRAEPRGNRDGPTL